MPGADEPADLIAGQARETDEGVPKTCSRTAIEPRKAGLRLRDFLRFKRENLAGLRRRDAEIRRLVAIDFEDVHVQNQLAARLFEFLDDGGSQRDGLRSGAQRDGVVAGIELRASDAGDFADHAEYFSGIFRRAGGRQDDRADDRGIVVAALLCVVVGDEE